MRKWLIVALIVSGASVMAQQHPDFSGEWLLAAGGTADADFASVLTVSSTIASTNVLGARIPPGLVEVRVVRHFAARDRIERKRDDRNWVGVADVNAMGRG
jgi:hypothetical protein